MKKMRFKTIKSTKKNKIREKIDILNSFFGIKRNRAGIILLYT